MKAENPWLTLFLAGAAAALVPTGGAAYAAVLYDNGVSDIDFGAPNSPKTLTFADNFHLETESIIDGVQFKGLYAYEEAPAEDSFILRLFEDDGGVPGRRVEYKEGVSGERTFVGKLEKGFNTTQDLYSYELNLENDAPEFQPDTDYWLSVTNEIPSWFWTGSTGDNLAIQERGEDWVNLDDELFIDFDFQLTGTPVSVSEPPPLTLLMTGVLALIGVGRGRKRKARRPDHAQP